MSNEFLEQDDESPWISISDLMSGLMLLFLFISIFLMKKQKEIVEEQTLIARKYREVQGELSEALAVEIDENERARWGAELMKNDLVIRFLDPEMKFMSGDATLTSGFQGVMRDFFPQFISVLGRTEFRDHIREIRIEGHTSSEWLHGGIPVTPQMAYLYNMELSQRRAFSVLTFAIGLASIESDGDWLRRCLRANGLSSSQRIVDDNNVEDVERSRRVDFRVVTDAEDRMKEIIRSSGMNAI